MGDNVVFSLLELQFKTENTMSFIIEVIITVEL